jgi:hypothetical protein
VADLDPVGLAYCGARSPLNQAVDAFGGFSIDEGGIFLIFTDPLGSSLFGFEQLLHGHRLVEMVLPWVICSPAIRKHTRRGALAPGFKIT